jgi:hypothetical protein
VEFVEQDVRRDACLFGSRRLSAVGLRLSTKLRPEDLASIGSGALRPGDEIILTSARRSTERIAG